MKENALTNMQIKIQADTKIVTFSDERFNNDAFMEITIIDAESGDIQSCDVPIAELMPAIIAFEAKRSKRLSDEAITS